MTGFRLLAAGFMTLLLSACASGPSDTRPDIQRTWDSATVVLPGPAGSPPLVTTMASPAMTRRVAAFGKNEKFPVVVYLHGCTGPGNQEFLGYLGAAGFAVIAPDSMARRYRPLQCDPVARVGGYNLFVYTFREAELLYVLQRMEGLPWVDRDNLFLIGSSEGGVTAALYRGADFNARVIAQWTCTGAPLVHGVGAPPETPILAIIRAGDPWYDARHAVGQQGHCGLYMKDRPNSLSLVLGNAPGHSVFDDPVSTRQIIDFLRRYLVP